MVDETTGGNADTTETLINDATAAGIGTDTTRADTAQAAKPSAADTIRDQASKFGNDAADRARALAGEGKDRATSALDEVARMFETAAGDVDAKLGEQYGQYARSAAQGISNFSESLRGKQVDDLLSDASDFVKKSPAIAVGAAAAIGFVLARLIKSGVDAAADLGDSTIPPKA